MTHCKSGQRDLDPERESPIIAAGHAKFVQIPNGDWWATFFSLSPLRGGLVQHRTRNLSATRNLEKRLALHLASGRAHIIHP
jgi:hypothetical protein